MSTELGIKAFRLGVRGFQTLQFKLLRIQVQAIGFCFRVQGASL